jgi:hypothetical protein
MAHTVTNSPAAASHRDLACRLDRRRRASRDLSPLRARLLVGSGLRMAHRRRITSPPWARLSRALCQLTVTGVGNYASWPLAGYVLVSGSDPGPGRSPGLVRCELTTISDHNVAGARPASAGQRHRTPASTLDTEGRPAARPEMRARLRRVAVRGCSCVPEGGPSAQIRQGPPKSLVKV